MEKSQKTDAWKDGYLKEEAALEWWRSVFGDVVVGWTFKGSAQLLIDNETTTVGPKFREYMALRMAEIRPAIPDTHVVVPVGDLASLNALAFTVVGYEDSDLHARIDALLAASEAGE